MPVAWGEPAPGVGRATLDRPGRRNAYDRQLCRELLAAIDRYRGDDRLRCLIVTGSGGAFCAGGDIKGDDPELEAVLVTQLGWARELVEDMQAVVLALDQLDKPTVAAIDGPAVAGGLTLALMCDSRIAGSSARSATRAAASGCYPTRAVRGSSRASWDMSEPCGWSSCRRSTTPRPHSSWAWSPRSSATTSSRRDRSSSLHRSPRRRRSRPARSRRSCGARSPAPWSNRSATREWPSSM